MQLYRMERPDLMAYSQLGKIKQSSKMQITNEVWQMVQLGQVDLFRFQDVGCIGTLAVCIDDGELLIYQAAGYDSEGHFCEKLSPAIKELARTLGIKKIRAHTRKDSLARLYRRIFDSMTIKNGEYVFRAVSA